MKPMARMGRPELPPEERRNVKANFMVRSDEYQAIKDAAQSEGMGIGEWIRKVLIPAANRAKKKTIKKG